MSTPLRDRRRIAYRLDADDRVTVLGSEWAEFALDNAAPELATAEKILLWESIADTSSRLLWQSLVARVRETGVTLEIPYRCDAPSARRWFRMRVTRGERATVLFESFLVREEPRETVRLIDPHSRREDTAAPVTVCSWCARALAGTEWVDIEHAVSRLGLLAVETPPPLSHGICPACFKRVSETVAASR